MNGLIKKASVLVLSVLVLVGGSLGGVSSAYAKSFYQLPDPYVMDRSYQNLLKYQVLGYKDNLSDAIKVLEDFSDGYSPRRRISNNEYLSKLSFEDHFKNGYEFIQFLIQYGRHLKNGIYILEIEHYYHKGSYYYIIQVGYPLRKVSSISSNSPKKPLPDPYVMDKGNQKLFNYEVVGYKDDLDDAVRFVEGYANKDFPKHDFYKDASFPQKHFYNDVYSLGSQYHDVFKNGYEFIQFLKKHYFAFKRGYYILQIANYYNGGFYYYIIKFY